MNKFLAAARRHLGLAIELVALAAIVGGIAMVYVPAALIVGGSVLIVAVERQPEPREKR